MYVWGVDFDKCCDVITGKFSPETWQVVIDLDSYGEYSPSGTGAHVLGISSKPRTDSGRSDKVRFPSFPGCKQIEVKGLGYYFTFSNRHLSKTPSELVDRTEQIHALYHRVSSIATLKKDTGLAVTMSVSDGERFKMLMAGDMSLYEGNKVRRTCALQNARKEAQLQCVQGGRGISHVRAVPRKVGA